MKKIENIISEQLVGRQCNWFRYLAWGTVILYFKDKDFDTNPDSHGKKFWIDCAWRLCKHEAILVGSLDEPDKILRELKRIENQTLNSFEVNEISGDLRLAFQDGLVIESFTHAVATELWEFRRSDGLRIGIGPELQPYERFEEPDQEGREEET